MNQILEYNPTSIQNQPIKSNKPNKQKGTGGNKKILKFFAIFLIIFAIAIMVLAGSRMIGREKVSTSSSAGEATSSDAKPTISVVELDSTIKITVEGQYEIEKIVYSWNSQNEIVIKGEGTTKIEKEIDLPAGENQFSAKAIDVQGNEETFQAEYTSENGKDILKPVVEVSVTDDKKLKIVATDETAMEFITYRWNEDEEKRLEVNPSTPTVITTTIEIPHGSNNITVIAVDSSNNTESYNKEYKGLTNPDIKFVLENETPGQVKIVVTHENGLKGISGTRNGQEFKIAEEDITSNQVDFTLTLSEGLNIIQVSASSTDGTEKTVEKEFQFNGSTINTAPEPETPETQPKVSAEVVGSGNDKSIKVTMSYKNKIASCLLNFNGQDYDVSITEDQSTPLTFELPMQEGENKIHLTVKGTDGTSTEYENTFTK